MIKKLIVNADDFGMTEGTTIGILLAHQKGIVTSTTCMMNMPYAEFALKEAQKFKNLGVGVHLTITVGKPLIDGAKSFTDEKGCFRRKPTYPDNQPHADLEELYNEWKAQIEKYISITGHKPTHLDSHHHVHLLPWHIEVTKKLSAEYDVPIRQRDQIIDSYEYARCEDHMYDDDVNYTYFTNALKKDETVLEYMCHPALVDQELYDMSSYSLARMKEYQLLTSEELKTFIQENHIELISFSDLKKN